ncbi:ubiquitin carboxy-terminal hydrolase (macronuclear) [Tetrahymena thermophila SB210]|uniref:Ubiquitin carboxy-terminal hydrolase n=1 Tax=Tetrahymena thermophila (strain SB210) TaxID=312017 RepID=I7MHB3_TETTS|nr:ubiquitin carboxy-terminal hydrolase [Tetrahymena thermophila SB210]EAS02785.2 ubiquitin carboxy-terminal hydrolase [Tetrahymena thermophila SB210]|eukprot:XP_001023030.2 ubiquitin carboxy-terminal hydrolase [Tetrahymena thermophila SB210]
MHKTLSQQAIQASQDIKKLADKPIANSEPQSDQISNQKDIQQKYIFSEQDIKSLEKNIWLEVKEKAERLVIGYESNFMPIIKKTINLLDLMIEASLQSFNSQQITFFIDEILFTVVKNIIEHKEYQTEENYLIAEQIIIKTLVLINQSIQLDIPKLSEIFAYIFNTQRSLYSKTILLKSPPQSDYPLGYEFDRDENRRQWEQNLKIGDIIDCIKFECYQKRQSWSRALIERIDDTSVSVKYLNDQVDDRIFTKSSYQIAPLGTKSLDFEWREQLKVGDEVDFVDSYNIWRNATILEIKEVEVNNGTIVKSVLVGLRIYREDGNRLDEQNGKSYFGYDKQLDEWVSPHSGRLQRFNRLARKQVQQQTLKNYLDYTDDANDIIFEIENKANKIYAIQRTDKNNNLVRYINYFGEIGGFDNILKRLQNFSNWCPLEITQYYLEGIHNIHIFLFLDFVREYIPQMWKATQYLLMNPSEANLRTYDKEKLESIISSLEVLLSRAFSYSDQVHETEKLSMSLALKCYQTDVLKQRLAGLKLICEIIKYVKQNSYKSSDNLIIKPAKFVEWIKTNNIIEDLYLNNIHSEMINRSAEFFKFMLSQNLFTEQLAREMFNAIDKQDQMTKRGFLKLLSEISSEPRRTQAKYIIQNIQRTEAKELTIEQIDVIYELALKHLQNITICSDDKKSEIDTQSEEYLFDTNPVNKNTIDSLFYFYDLTVGKDFQNMSAELKAHIIDKFSCLIRTDDGRPQRVQFLIKCIDDIKKNVSVYHLLNIIKQIISTYYTELQIKGCNNNPNTNNQNLIIKLNPTTDEKEPKLNVNEDKQNQESKDSKKRSNSEKDNSQSAFEENCDNNDNESPQKKKNRRDGTLVNSPKQLLEFQQNQNVAKQNENIVNINGDNTVKNSIDLGQPKSKIADMLVNEYKLVETVLSNIRQVKVIYKKMLDSPNTLSQDRKGLLTQFRFEVSERIDFIKFINSILEDDKKIITTSFLTSIWKDIVENPLDIDERDLLFKWLRELADEKGGLVHEVAQFFKQQLLLNTEFVEHLSLEGFLCYKVMFISLNLQKNYLQQQQIPKNNYTTNVYGAICSMSGGPMNNNQSSNEDQNNEFEYLVLTEPQNLEGMDLLWEIVYKNGQESVIENCIDFLVKLHLHISATSNINCGQIRKNFIDHCMESIISSYGSNITKVKRTLDILNCLLNESEKKGIGYLKPINGLVKGEVQNLTITNEINAYVQEGQKKQDIKIESNKTIIDLKILIASKINTSWDQIKIKRSPNFKQLRDSDNSRTIGEIRFKSNENLTIEKRQTPPIPEANLLNQDGSLVEKAKQIFTSWFETFSTEGFMDAENLAKFIHSCTNDSCRPDDHRVTSTIAQYDHDNDGKLDLQDFLNFYRKACQEKKAVVWKNLQSHYYRNDLKKLSDVGEDVEDIEILPRNIIMKNPQCYEVLMKILDNEQVSENAINLLNRLPASPDLVRKVLNLEGVKGNNQPDWSLILDTKNSQRLLYTLTIIEYLMEDNQVLSNNSDDQNQSQQEQKTQEEAKEQQPNSIKEQKDQQNQKDSKTQDQPETPKEDILKNIYSDGASIDPANWREEFIQCGGFDQLFKVFIQYSQQDYSKLTINTKNILSFILRIMKNYLTAVFANKVTHLYKINQYAIQVKYSLDVINENLKKAEEQKNDEEEEKKEESKENNDAKQQKQAQPTPQVTPYHPNLLEQNVNQNMNNNTNENNNNSNAPIVGPYSKINFTSIWANRSRVKETPDFLILKEKLSGKLGQKIMDTLDIESMLTKIIEILFNVVSLDSELESEDRVIIDFCWCIIIDIVLYDTKQREILVKKNFEQFSRLIMKGLFNQNLNARRVFSHALYLISRQDKGVFSSFLLDLLMKNVPSSKDVSKSDCNQYYELLCKIIEESTDFENIQINFQDLMDFMVQNIKDHISQESRYNAKNDKMLIGFLNMCEKILKIEPNLGNSLEQFAEYLFDVCLFCKNPEGLLDDNLDFDQIQQNQVYEFNPPYYVKCKSSDSRRGAYKILNSILKTNKKMVLNIIKDGLNVLIDTLIPPPSWSYRPSNEQKCHQNYLGIKNLSQICYMNSMLQQFYMTKTFRYAILATDDEKEAEIVEYRGMYIDDNILHQIQKMFAFLDLSDRQDYNPVGFCFSFKDFSGKPVNVGVQQDAQEFLNMIFEKLETSLRPTPFKYVLESVFGGQTISQMTCSSCGNVKAKYELFYTQQLRVEGCKKLSDSFNKMIEGETISDFKCDACEKRCDQFRRICFSQLPNILIIQLQRIVFDLDTFVNKKINTKLEFPHNLDLKEYTVEYLDSKENELKVERKESTNSDSHKQQQISKKDENYVEDNANVHPPEYYKYRLKGITVHQGTAELGHYYSYINYKEDKWLEFNDSRIREFNPQNIEQECFGGSSSNYSENYWEKGENSKNAYILVYERELKTPLKIVTKNEDQRLQVENSLNIKIGEPQQKQEEEQISYVDYYSINQRIPMNQFKSAWLDNHNFMLEKHVYSLEFIQFLKELIWMIEKPKDFITSLTSQSFIYKNHKEIPERDQQIYYNSLQMCAKLFFNIFYKSADFEILKDLLVHMKGMLDLIPQYTYEFAKEFIFSRFKQIESVLTSCSESVVRSCYQQIINFTINNLINYHNIQLNISESFFIGKDDDQFTEAELAERDINVFLERLLDIMHTEVSKNWLRMQQYLEIFRDFAFGGDVQIQWCFNKEMIARLIDFFLGNISPLNCYGQKKHEIGNRFVQTPFGPLLQNVCFLIQKVKWNMNSDKTYTFSENDQIALNSQEFYWKSMQENYDSQSICLIGQFLSHKEKIFSQSFGSLILRGINKTNCDHVKQYLDLMSSFLAITDEHQQIRIEWIFGYANLVINPNDGYEMKQNLEEQVVIYETRLKYYENVQPVLNLLYHYRKLQENLCLHILHRVLLMCKSDQFYRFLHYLMKLPAPSYSCSHYLSWVRPHLESIINDNQKNYMANQKEELAKQCLSIYEDIEKIINNYAVQKQDDPKKQQEEAHHTEQSIKESTQVIEECSKTSESSPQSHDKQECESARKEDNQQQNLNNQEANIGQKGLMSLWTNYIIGKTLQIGENRWIPVGEENEQPIYLRELEYTTYYTDSQPNGNTNLIFPDVIKSGSSIQLSSIKLEESNINDFLYVPTQNNSGSDFCQLTLNIDKSKFQNNSSTQQINQEKKSNSSNQKVYFKVPRKVQQEAKRIVSEYSDNEYEDENEVFKRNKKQAGSNDTQQKEEALNDKQLDASDNNGQDDSIDSFKANIGEEVNHSGLPSSSNYGLNCNQNQDDKEVYDVLNVNLDEATQDQNSQDLNKEKYVKTLQSNTKNLLNQLEEFVENQNKDSTNDQSQQQQQQPIPTSDEVDQKQQCSELVCVTHIINLKKEIGNVVRRFQIENNSESHIKVLVNFQLQDENTQENINQHMPFEIYVQVEPKSTISFFSMRKINPSRDWSDYSISVQYEVIENIKVDQSSQKKNDNQNDCQFKKASTVKNQQEQSSKTQSNNQKQDQDNQTDQKEFSFKNDNNQDSNLNNRDNYENNPYAVKIGPQLPDKLDQEYYGMEACPVCTYLQPSINVLCEMCGSSLK